MEEAQLSLVSGVILRGIVIGEGQPSTDEPVVRIETLVLRPSWRRLLRGRLVWRQDLSSYGPGRHQVTWQGQDGSGKSLPSGLYFYRLTSGASVATRKMVLAR